MFHGEGGQVSPPSSDVGALVISVQDSSGYSKMSVGGLTGASLLDQAGDSDDDNEPVRFMSQMGEFNLTAHPEGEDAELNRVVGDVDVTTYGELNLIAEPQKVRTCHRAVTCSLGRPGAKPLSTFVVRSPEAAVSLVQELLGLLLDALFPDEPLCKGKELRNQRFSSKIAFTVVPRDLRSDCPSGPDSAAASAQLLSANPGLHFPRSIR